MIAGVSHSQFSLVPGACLAARARRGVQNHLDDQHALRQQLMSNVDKRVSAVLRRPGCSGRDTNSVSVCDLPGKLDDTMMTAPYSREYVRWSARCRRSDPTGWTAG